MCGINGILSKKGLPIDIERFKKMRDSLSHRGPDDAGLWAKDEIAFGHRRLSIIDVSNQGHQPFFSNGERFVMVYNGEIYNYKELKKKYFTAEDHFESETDTEVLLKLFEKKGEQIFDELNGIFAFAIWDQQKQELFLCRDRLGVKPLYLFENDDFIAFASEPKAFFEYGFPKEVDEANVSEWLVFRYVAGKETLLKGVKSVLPGSFISVRKKNEYLLEEKSWWNLNDCSTEYDDYNPLNWFSDLFNSSVRYRMVSDVPVGVLLSGGLDSSSIVSSLSIQNYQEFQNFNVGFKDFKDDESKRAEAFSKRLNIPFHSIQLDYKNAYEDFAKATYHHDFPLIHQNDPHLIAISKYANQYVKVLLSGEGADELMGGYVRYRPLKYLDLLTHVKPIINSLPNSLINGRINKLKRFLSLESNRELIQYNSVNYFPSDYLKYGFDAFEIENPYRIEIASRAERKFPKNTFRQALFYDQHTYLCSLNDRNDRATMASSIECREPFQDFRLVQGLMKLPDKWLFRSGIGKQILRRSFDKALGKETTRFRKIGFSIPWLNSLKGSEQLNQVWNGLGNDPAMEIGSLGLLNISKIQKDYLNGDHSNESLLRHLTMFSIWHSDYVKS